MAIISISLNEKMLEEIDKIGSGSGFSGRSEVIRAGVRKLIADNKENEQLVGKIKSVLLLVHSQKAEEISRHITHEFDDIISTQTHSKLHEDKCLEIFILDGDAERVKEMLKFAQVSKRLDYIKLIVP